MKTRVRLVKGTIEKIEEFEKEINEKVELIETIKGSIIDITIDEVKAKGHLLATITYFPNPI
jgi:hypothetical protein